jgi:hemimethylated DNA binding protein
MVSLQFTCFRRSFRYERFVQEDLVPFFHSLHPQTFEWITSSAPTIKSAFRREGEISQLPFATAVRLLSQRDSPSVRIQTLSWVERVHARVQNTSSRTLVRCNYSFDIGDVVVNRQLGHLGVVAAKLPICFESDDWIREHLGSLNDHRLIAPWYLILVGHHRGVPVDFSRYGSELTHERVSGVKSIGLNRHLSSYFRGFDPVAGRYIPL